MNKKILAIAAVAVIGGITAASASNLNHLFEPQNYKWFEQKKQSEDYDYVSGDGQEADLADQDQKSEENTGDSQQAVQLGKLQFTDADTADTENRSDVLGTADLTGANGGQAGNGVVFTDNTDGVNGTTVLPGGNTANTGDAAGAVTEGDSDNTVSGDTDHSDTTAGNKNNGNSDNNNGNQNGGNTDIPDDNGDDQPLTWEEQQLRPKNSIETKYGVLTGLSATIQKDAYYLGETFAEEDAVVTATFQKDGKTVTKTLSYGGEEGYGVQFSTGEKGNLTAVFSYPANAKNCLTARASYYVLQSAIQAGYQAQADNGVTPGYYYRKDFPGLALTNIDGVTSDTVKTLEKLISPPASNPDATKTVNMMEVHRAMIALLGDNQVQFAFLNTENYRQTVFLDVDAQGYLTNMLTGFSWIVNGTRMDGENTYVYYPGGNWGTTQRLAVDVVQAVPDGYKIRREATKTKNDWSTYRGDQILEKYTGTDSTLSVPMGVTAINLNSEAESVTTLSLPNSVQEIDAESIADNLPNLTAYEYASADTIQNSVGAYKIVDGILYSADGKTLISVPPAKKNVVIADTVTTLGKNCLKGVSADVQFAGSTIPAITETTGYAGTVIVPDSTYNLVCKNFMFAFGAECEQISFQDASGRKMNCEYDANGPQLISRRGKSTVLEALPKYLSGKYTVDSGIDSIGKGAFVNCVKLTDLEIGSSVKELGDGSLVLPTGISDVRLTGSDISVSKYVFGKPADGAKVPDITISVSEADYEDYLRQWSEVLDPVYGEGTAKRLLVKDTGSVFYEAGVKYQKVTENGQTHYELIKVYDDSLTALQVKAGTTRIRSGAFDGCNRLEILYLPDSVTKIASGVFTDISKLEMILTEGSADCVKQAGDISAEILSPGDMYSGFAYEDGVVYGTNVTGGETLLNVPTDYDQTLHVKADTTILYKEALKGCVKMEAIRLDDPTMLEEIGESCFENSKFDGTMNLDSCTSLTKIGAYAFRNNSSIQLICLPDSLTTLEEGTFYGCSSLTEVRMNRLQHIGDQTFYNCTSLRTISNFAQRAIGNELSQLESLGNQAFYGCRNLVTVSMGENMTEIGEECFENCVSLRSVEMNGTVPGISRYCFYGCRNLTDITFSEQQQAALKIIGVEAFGGCEQLKNIDFRDLTQLTLMGERTFSGCSSLITVKFPESLTKVPDYCFENCEKLSVLQLNATDITTLGTNVFGESVSDKLNITVPEDVMENYRSELENTLDSQYESGLTEQMLDKITDTEIIDDILYEIVPEGKILKKGYSYIAGSHEIEADTIEIADEAFKDCTGLTEIVIPNPATVKIGNRCFTGCTGLTSVQILGNVPEWGEETFMDCTAITSIVLGSYTTDGTTITYTEIDRIGDRAFKNCTGLTGTSTSAPVIIRGNIREFGTECFAGCSNWVSIAQTDRSRIALEKIDDYAFAGCKKLGSLLNSKFTGLTSIGAYAFMDCDSFGSPSIPVNVTSIGEGCFMDCDNVKYVSFYGGIKEYPKNCFKNCPKLLKTGGTAAAFSTLEKIGESAYEGCTSLLSAGNLNWGLEKYTNLKEIGPNAFKNCARMYYATIPANVTSIGAGAFDGCSSMSVITFNSATPPQIGAMTDIAFPENLSILVPDSQEEGDNVYRDYAKVLKDILGIDIVSNALNSKTDGAKDRVDLVAEISETEEIEEAGNTDSGEDIEPEEAESKENTGTQESADAKNSETSETQDSAEAEKKETTEQTGAEGTVQEKGESGT